eukprot:8465659-Lingulodinium_polyedra.AAC.1
MQEPPLACPDLPCPAQTCPNPQKSVLACPGLPNRASPDSAKTRPGPPDPLLYNLVCHIKTCILNAK